MKEILYPRSIAVIGASDNEKKVGGILLKKLLMFKGNIIPVNPHHNSIFGKKCYKNVGEYKKKIDLAIIAVPSKTVSLVLKECGKKKIKSVIIISAGFSEIGNFDEEKELGKIARKYGIRFLGPNCFGIVNPRINLDCTFSKTSPKKNKIAFISQSGALWSYISDFCYNKLGFSGFVSLGNMADLEFSDFIEYFSNDKNTKSIILYIEKLKDGKRFINVCRKSKKKIFAVKAGSSEKGSQAAFSHTGSLATDFRIYKGIFKQSNVTFCNSLLEALEKASGKRLIHKTNAKFGKKLFIITNAGGAGALLSDYLTEKGCDIASSKLKNPLDLLGTATSFDYKNAFEMIKRKKFYDSIIVVITPQSMTDIDNIAEEIINFKKKTKKRISIFLLGSKSVKNATKLLKKNNIPCYNTLEEII